MTGQTNPKRGELTTYATGYAGALALTGISYGLVYWRPFSNGWTLGVILVLALIQILVHFRFFLHVSLRRSMREDLQLLLFSSVIILLMVGGTLVVLFNLRERMM